MAACDPRQVQALSSFLVSLIVHLCVAIILVLWLCPAPRSEQAASTLHVTWAAEEAVDSGLDSFTSSLEEDLEIDLADSTTLAESPEGEAELQVELSGPGGGRRAGGRSSAARKSGSANPADGKAGDGSSQAEFFGTVAYGDRFVFLLDMSRSMDGNVDQQGTRFDRAREELIRSIEQLNERQSFCVTLFCYRTRPMFDDPVLGRTYLSATEENKDRLKAWLRRIKPEPGTDPRDALAAGLSLRPSAVFLLSDGDFNGPARIGDTLFGNSGEVHETADAGRQIDVPIHTIAYEDPVGAKNMKDLSGRSGGEYRFVEASEEAARNPSGGGPSMVVRNDEYFAAKQLQIGKGHESLGRTERAVAHYRQVIAKHPKTNSAQEAGRRIERLIEEGGAEKPLILGRP